MSSPDKKLRRLENLKPEYVDDEDTVSNKSYTAAAPRVQVLERKNRALALELKEVKKKLAQERATSDSLRGELADKRAKLDFAAKATKELSRSVAAFGGILLMQQWGVCPENE